MKHDSELPATREQRVAHQLTCRLPTVIAATVCAAILGACGGGGGSDTPSAVAKPAYGPSNAAACPRGQTSDVWFNKRLDCLGAGQLFVTVLGATGDKADRAFIVGQEVLDLSIKNVLGGNLRRYFKYALCVKNAPANVSGQALATDMGTALGLNVLVSGASFIPPGVSGSTFVFGGIDDVNVLQAPCDPLRFPVIVNYETGRIDSVNPAALGAVAAFER